MHDPVWWFFNKACDEHSMRQKQILEGEGRCKAIMAGNRAGKSCLLGLDIAATLRGCHPFRQTPRRPIRGLFLVPGRRQGITVWKRKLLECCELRGPQVPESIQRAPMIPSRDIRSIGWDATPNGRLPVTYLMKNGNEMHLAWSGTPRQRELVQGPAFDWVWIDEGACDEALLDEVIARLGDAIGDPMAPGFGGIMWSATMTSDRYAGYQSYLEKCRDPDNPDFQLYTLDRDTNPALSEEAKGFQERAWGTDISRVRSSGMTAVDRLAVFPQFQEHRHVLETDYEPGLYDTIYATYDPGVAHRTGMALWCFPPEKPETAHLWRYWEPLGLTVEQEVFMMVQALNGRFLEAFIADPASKKRQRTQGGFVSTIELVAAEFEKFGYLCGERNKIKQGFLLTRDNVEEMGSINGHNAGIKDVRAALDRDLIKMSPSHESGGRQAINRLKAYQFKDFQSIYQGIGMVKKKDDEFPDMLRYLIRWRAKHFDRGPNPPAGYQMPMVQESVEEARRRRSEQIANEVRRRNRRRRA